MLYVAQQPQLPVGPFAVDEGLERPIQLLNRNLLLGLLVDGRAGRRPDTQLCFSGLHSAKSEIRLLVLSENK